MEKEKVPITYLPFRPTTLIEGKTIGWLLQKGTESAKEELSRFAIGDSCLWCCKRRGFSRGIAHFILQGLRCVWLVHTTVKYQKYSFEQLLFL